MLEESREDARKRGEGWPDALYPEALIVPCVFMAHYELEHFDAWVYACGADAAWRRR